MQTEKDTTVILANGTFPSSQRPLEILRSAARVVCCDGAADACLAAGFLPEVVIGDLDSLPKNLTERLSERIVHVSEQETNDLNKALRYCLEHGWDSIVILGATGKREDHTLGNLSLLVDFSEKIPDISMVTDDGEFIVLRHSGTSSCRCGQQISIFAMEPDTHIESRGLKYPLNGLAPTRWWQATLNEALGDSFSLQFPDNHPLLIYKAF
ncbi:MAG: thiamine diphosphokinase [Victivallales bacterium]|nr:thiamine diphosphokinase [Victivallales bacterium]